MSSESIGSPARRIQEAAKQLEIAAEQLPNVVELSTAELVARAETLRRLAENLEDE